MRRATAPHYLLRDPGLLMPLVALVLNVLLITTVLIQVRGLHNTVKVSFVSSSPVQERPRTPAAMPVLQVKSDNELQLNGEAVANVDELRYRLSAKGGARSAMIVRTAAGLPVEVLARVLRECARAGFTDVAVETVPQVGK